MSLSVSQTELARRARISQTGRPASPARPRSARKTQPGMKRYRAELKAREAAAREGARELVGVE